MWPRAHRDLKLSGPDRTQTEQVIDMATFRFGQHIIKSSVIFLQTELSFALVNRKPVVPGRILFKAEL
ncbi:hypothetical protein chiPu_0000293 [Chiloscyllium punctatum]|uniref:Uncharacterized protein n=1 Tax=Chiloscyllium punctatum TaxID=137246 RepID=A0A401RUS5_CHIPU|nr:hypothetical protein [Chiloscyllium punctatum]